MTYFSDYHRVDTPIAMQVVGSPYFTSTTIGIWQGAGHVFPDEKGPSFGSLY